MCTDFDTMKKNEGGGMYVLHMYTLEKKGGDMDFIYITCSTHRRGESLYFAHKIYKRKCRLCFCYATTFYLPQFYIKESICA